MANDININESAILETLNAKIDYDGGNYPSSGLERKVNSTRVSKSGDTMTGSLISEQSSYYQFVAKSTVIDATATPTVAQYVGIDFKDKNDVRLGWFGVGKDKNGTTYFNMMNFKDASDGFMFPRCTTKATTTSSAANHKVAVIVQNYKSGNSWYRVWSDGWIEQGGQAAEINANVTITFPKAFTEVPTVLMGHVTTRAVASYEREVWPNTISKTQFTTTNLNCSGSYTRWYACGY